MASEISADSGTPATRDTDQPAMTRPSVRASLAGLRDQRGRAVGGGQDDAGVPATAWASVSASQCGGDSSSAAISASMPPSSVRRMPMRSMRAARKKALAAVAAP